MTRPNPAFALITLERRQRKELSARCGTSWEDTGGLLLQAQSDHAAHGMLRHVHAYLQSHFFTHPPPYLV